MARARRAHDAGDARACSEGLGRPESSACDCNPALVPSLYMYIMRVQWKFCVVLSIASLLSLTKREGNKISYNFLQKTAYSFHKKFFLFNCVFNHSLRSPRVRSNHSLTSTWQLLYKPNRMINMSSSCFHHSGHHSIFCYLLEYYAVVLRINASGTSSKTMTSDHIFLEKTNSRSFSEKTPAIAGCCSSIRPKRAIVSSNIFFYNLHLQVI